MRLPVACPGGVRIGGEFQASYAGYFAPLKCWATVSDGIPGGTVQCSQLPVNDLGLCAEHLAYMRDV